MSSTAVAVDVKRCRPFSFSLQITSQDELLVVYKYIHPLRTVCWHALGFLLSLWLPFAAFLVPKCSFFYETAMGYRLFKMSDNARLEEADLYKEFETPERANKLYVAGCIVFIYN